MNYILETIKNNDDISLLIFVILFFPPLVYLILKMNSGPKKTKKE